MERFAQILYDLGQEINVDLYPDANRICQVNYKDKLHIQLHYDELKEQILIATFVCEIPPGKYRETLLKAALISNNEYPKIGILAYSERNNQLTLFHYVSTKNLHTETLFKTLENFVEKASLWKEAVENGNPLPIPPEKGPESAMFGLKS